MSNELRPGTFRAAWLVWKTRPNLLTKIAFGLVVVLVLIFVLEISKDPEHFVRNGPLSTEQDQQIRFTNRRQLTRDHLHRIAADAQMRILVIEAAELDEQTDLWPLQSTANLKKVYIGRIDTQEQRSLLAAWQSRLPDITFHPAWLSSTLNSRLRFCLIFFGFLFGMVVWNFVRCCARPENDLLPCRPAHRWVALMLLGGLSLCQLLVMGAGGKLELWSSLAMLSVPVTLIALLVCWLGVASRSDDRAADQIAAQYSPAFVAFIVICSGSLGFLPAPLEWYIRGGRPILAAGILAMATVIVWLKFRQIARPGHWKEVDQQSEFGTAKQPGVSEPKDRNAHKAEKWCRITSRLRPHSPDSQPPMLSRVYLWWLGSSESWSGLLVSLLIVLTMPLWSFTPKWVLKLIGISADVGASDPASGVLLIVMMAGGLVGAQFFQRRKLFSAELMWPQSRAVWAKTTLQSVFIGLLLSFTMAGLFVVLIQWTTGHPMGLLWMSLLASALGILAVLSTGLLTIILTTRHLSLAVVCGFALVMIGGVNLGIASMGQTAAGPQPFFSNPLNWLPILAGQAVLAVASLAWAWRRLNTIEVENFMT